MKVRCNWCEWMGSEFDLLEDENGIEKCPKCKTGGFLMDINEFDDNEEE